MNTVRVYVAAPFSEYKLVREVQAALRARGAEITCDWTLEADKPGNDSDLTEEIALQAALADLQGVADADAVLLLTVADKSLGCGMWVELGFALGCRVTNGDEGYGSTRPLATTLLVNQNLAPRIAICGPQRERNVFNRLGKRFAEWQDALPYVLGTDPLTLAVEHRRASLGKVP